MTTTSDTEKALLDLVAVLIKKLDEKHTGPCAMQVVYAPCYLPHCNHGYNYPAGWWQPVLPTITTSGAVSGVVQNNIS